MPKDQDPNPNPEPGAPFRPTPITPIDFTDDPPVDPPQDPPQDPPTDPPQDPPAPILPLDDLFATPPVDPPQDPPQDPPTDPPQDPPADDLVSRLRSQIKESKREAEQERERLEQEAAAAREEAERYRQEAAIANPLVDEGVVSANKNLENGIKNIARTMTDPSAARRFLETAKTLADEYKELGDIYSDGYDERYNKFREKVEQNFGDNSDALLREMPKVDELRNAMDEAVAKANSTSVDSVRQRQLSMHQETAKVFKAAVNSTLSYNEELTKIDPYAAQNVIAKMIENIPEFGESSQGLISVLESGLLPPKPILPEDAPSLSAAERQAKESERMAVFQQSSGEIQKLIPLAFHAMQAVPILSMALAEAKSKLSAYQGDAPSPRRSIENPVPGPPSGGPGDSEDRKYRPITKGELMGD